MECDFDDYKLNGEIQRLLSMICIPREKTSKRIENWIHWNDLFFSWLKRLQIIDCADGYSTLFRVN